MNKYVCKKILTLILLSLLSILPATSNADINLNFGVYTSDKPSSMVKKFRPVLNAIEKTMSQQLDETVKISLQISSGYDKGIDALVQGKVDFARFGPASYVLAKEKNADIGILAIESKNGGKVFNGLLCVHKDSDIKTVADVKGKRFAFGNKRSTIGRFLSQSYLYRHGVFAKDLAGYDYLGRHDKVGAAVANGQYDVGAIKEGTFNKLVKKGAPLRSIADFPNVTKPWIARSGLSEQIYAALKASLLMMKDNAALKALKKDGFIAGSDQDYEVIRESISSNNRFFK